MFRALTKHGAPTERGRSGIRGYKHFVPPGRGIGPVRLIGPIFISRIDAQTLLLQFVIGQVLAGL